jgi:hypothetical protein
MHTLNEQHIDFILQDIKTRGIKLESLQDDLLDHICILIEQTLEKEEDFLTCYQSTIRTFYRRDLKEVEDATTLLLSCRNRLILTRTQFFVFLFTILIGPFAGRDLAWLLTSGPAAGWTIPLEIWAPTVVYPLFPLLILLVLLLTPKRLDPLIPHGSKILLGLRPFVKIVP